MTINTQANRTYNDIWKKAQQLVAIGLIAVLSACSGGGGGKATGVPTQGSFLDAPVQGLSYMTSSQNFFGPRKTWKKIASSADGVKLAAASTDGQIYTSTDSGVTWATHGPSQSWSGLASSSDGTKLAATPHGGQIYTSTDSGVTWTARASNQDWSGIASSSDGTKLAAVTYGGQIYTSTDSGVTWTAHGAVDHWNGIATSSDGTNLVAFTTPYYPSTTLPKVYKSTDSGVTWTATGVPTDFYSGVTSSSDGSKLAVVSINDRIYTSADSGANWTVKNMPVGQGHQTATNIVSSTDGTTLIVSEYEGPIYVSNDSGLTWNGFGMLSDWSSIATSADGLKWIAGNGYYTDPFFIVQKVVHLTGPGGSYSCKTGEMVQFYLGNMALGSVKCHSTVQVYQMVGSGDNATKGVHIAQLLQSLNISGNPANIVLPDLSTVTTSIDLNASDANFATNAAAYLTAVGQATGKTFTLVSPAAAKLSVQNELQKLHTTSPNEFNNLCSVNTCNSDLLNSLKSAGGISGTVTGLTTQTIQLQLNLPSGFQKLTIGSNGNFGFPKNPLVGDNYQVSRIDSDASIICSITNAQGIASGLGVSNVSVSCAPASTNPVPLPIIVTGLGAGQSVTLTQTDTATSASSVLTVSADGIYVMPGGGIPAGGAAQTLSAATNDPYLVCSLATQNYRLPAAHDANFTFPADAISCVSRIYTSPYSLGGTVTGLSAGDTLILQNNGGGSISVGNGPYTFGSNLTGPFSIAASTLAGLSCSVTGGSGQPFGPQMIADIVCSGNKVGGVVTGLGLGASVSLQVVSSAGTTTISVPGNGTGSDPFKSIYLPNNSPYTVTVASTSANTTCGAVTNGTGTLAGADVTNLSLTCATSAPTAIAAGTLGGNISGLGPLGAMITNSVNGDTISVVPVNGATSATFRMPVLLSPGATWSFSVMSNNPMVMTPPVCTFSTPGTMPAVTAVPNYVTTENISCTGL